MVLFVLAVNKGLCTTFRTVLVEMAFVHELFPAHAGVIPGKKARKTGTGTFPRPRGGDPIWLNGLVGAGYFSPHVRGFHIDNPAQKADNRFILNAERGKVYAVF